MAIPKRQTAEGFEMQLGTNHLEHYALDGLLIDLLMATPNSWVVTVSSYAHILGWMRFTDLQSEKYYQKWLAYGQSKLANLLFAYELQRKLTRQEGNTISVAAHPGWAATNLQHSSGFFSALNPILAQSQAMGFEQPVCCHVSNPARRGVYRAGRLPGAAQLPPPGALQQAIV